MKRSRLSVDEYFDGIISGDRITLGKAITLIESRLESDRKISKELIDKILPYTGKSLRIGITGIPGVGKSTFIEQFGLDFIKNHDKKISVLAIDPSSQKTHGSILGDKTRMEELSKNLDAFIRPSPAGDSLGGVAGKTREAMLLCEAAGYDLIFVETVGVGQSETAVYNMTDVFLLLTMAGTGDELQGIKKGIMEMADFIVINKADGDNLPKALKTKNQLEMVLHIFPLKDNGWNPEVITCSSLNGENIDNVVKQLFKFEDHVRENGYLDQNRKNQNLKWMDDYIQSELLSEFFNENEVKESLLNLRDRVLSAKVSPYSAADELIALFRNKRN